MKLHDLHPTPGSRKPSRRVGRGHGSGRGKTAGRGTKGQKSRAGGNLPAWFEGGQTPLHIRTPKLHGFRNRGRVEYAPINLGRLGEVERGTLVTPDVLAHDGLIDDTKRPVKILGVGDAPAGITVHAHAFSRSALDKLGAAGSTVQLLSWPDNAPIDERPPRPEGKRLERRRAGIARAERVAAGGDAAPIATRRQAGQARGGRCRRRGAGSSEDRGGRARRRGERKRAHGLIDTVVTAFRAPDIRAKLLFTLGILAIFRALTNVPIPNVNTEALSNLFTDNPLLGILNIFSGGGLAAASIIGLGVNPYINASIIMQLMRGVIPALDELSREGEYGRNRINQYTRMLTVPLAMAQAYGISILLSANGVIPPTSLFSIETISLLLSFTAGTILLMWLGELISERGLGNGISLIIFAGIVGSIPQQIGPIISGPDALARLVPFIVLAVVVIAAVVFINEGQRRIPVQYASRVRGRRMIQSQTQYLPLKVTMAGVIPIIFAVSILLFPAQIAAYFTASDIEWVRNVATWISTNLNGQNNRPLYGTLYFLLVVFFTYFYTAFQFRPDQTADYLRKNGGFIPGIRPGKPTEQFLGRVTNRITLGGALFLGTIAVLPFIVSAIVPGTQNLQLGGTSILIIVSVVVETMKQLEAQMMMRHYEGFIR